MTALPTRVGAPRGAGAPGAARRNRPIGIAGVLIAALLSGCIHRHQAAPGPGTSQGTPPDLRGVKVMVFPVQRTSGVVGDADAEVAFGLQGRGPDVRWILPARLQEVLNRSPSMDTRTHGLPVAMFGAAVVKRVGDPLYGELRRLAALVDGQVAFIPLSVVAVTDSAGTGHAVEMAATLIDVESGQVLWFGVVKGASRPANGTAALASAVDAMARRLLWYEGG